LREAQRRTGISRFTLRKWLLEAGMAFPSIDQGSKFLIAADEIEKAILLHQPVALHGYAKASEGD